MKKYLFVDRDGTLIVEPPKTERVDSIEQVEFISGVIPALKHFINCGYEIAMVTNQDGLGTPDYPLEIYDAVDRHFLKIFAEEGITIDKIFICPHYPTDECDCRKPKVGILGDFLSTGEVDLENSLMVGDRITDIEFAQNIGVKGFWLLEQDWNEIISLFSET